MKILVTGGTGLVGSAIRKIIKDYPTYEFIFVSSKEYDLTSLTETRMLFLSNDPDIVIHLAANVGGLYKNMEKKVEILEDNLQINFNIVQCCYKYNIKKLIACLSTCIFPDNTEYPINENMLHNSEPHLSNEGYAYAKRMMEIHIRKYREQYNKDFICIIPSNIYGPNDNFNLEDSHVIPGLIHKCYLAKKNNTEFILKGTGKALRQFIYSDDIAKLIMKIIEKTHFPYPNIILAPEEEQSINCIANIIKTTFNIKNEIQYDTTYSDGQYKKTSSNKLLKEVFPDFQFTDIEKGLEETINWFNKNYDISRR